MSLVIDKVEDFIIQIAHPSIPDESECATSRGNCCWLLTPRQHAIDALLYPPIMVAIGFTFFYLHKQFRTKAHVVAHKKYAKECERYPLAITVFVCALYITYFAQRAQPEEMWRLVWFLAPCNLTALFICIASTVSSSTARYNWTRYNNLYAVFVMAPLFMPDLRNLPMAEIVVFYLVHAAVPLFTLYSIYTRRVRPSEESWLLVMAVAFFSLPIQSSIQTFASFTVGANVNYMLHPPPGFHWAGEQFKWMGFACSAVAFVVGHLWCLMWEKIFSSIGFAPAHAKQHGA